MKYAQLRTFDDVDNISPVYVWQYTREAKASLVPLLMLANARNYPLFNIPSLMLGRCLI